MDTVCMLLYLQTGKVMAWDFFPLNRFFSTKASITSCLASKRFFPLKGKNNGIRSFKRPSIALRNNKELHHFKTSDSSNEWQWPYCYSKIFYTSINVMVQWYLLNDCKREHGNNRHIITIKTLYYNHGQCHSHDLQIILMLWLIGVHGNSNEQR